MADPALIIANGMTVLLNVLNAMIPMWQGTATAIDHSAQAVTQIAMNTQHQQLIHVTVQQASAAIQVPLPDEFKGVRERAEGFLWQCNLYFTRVCINNDPEKIATALALIKGETAGMWADTQLEAIQESSANALMTWSTFCIGFKDQFADSSPKQMAVKKMKVLYMGLKTADQYNTLFNSFKGATGWNEEALIDQYRKGLTNFLRAKIYNCETLLKTLKGWQEKVDRLNHQELEYLMTLSTFAVWSPRNMTWQGTSFTQTPTTCCPLIHDSLY